MNDDTYSKILLPPIYMTEEPAFICSCYDPCIIAPYAHITFIGPNFMMASFSSEG
jgi:hypothetical protein